MTPRYVTATDTPYIKFGDQSGDWFELKDHPQMIKDMVTAKNFVMIFKDHDIHIVDKHMVLTLAKDDGMSINRALANAYGTAEMMAVHIQP